MNKYIINSSKGCVLEVDLEYPKELRELHKDYPLAPDKIERKREILSKYQQKVAYLDNIPICTVKKLVPKFFSKENYVFIYSFIYLFIYNHNYCWSKMRALTNKNQQ